MTNWPKGKLGITGVFLIQKFYVGDYVLSSKILKESKKEKSKEIPNISSLFYEGFGIKI